MDVTRRQAAYLSTPGYTARPALAIAVHFENPLTMLAAARPVLPVIGTDFARP